MQRFDIDIAFWSRRYIDTPIFGDSEPKDTIDEIINRSIYEKISIRHYRAYYRENFAETIDFILCERIAYKSQEILFLYMAALLGQRYSFIITHNLANIPVNILKKYDINNPLLMISDEDFKIINDALTQASNGRYIIPSVENDNLMAPIYELIEYASFLKSYGSDNYITPEHLVVMETNFNYLRNSYIAGPGLFYSALETARQEISFYDWNRAHTFPTTIHVNDTRLVE